MTSMTTMHSPDGTVSDASETPAKLNGRVDALDGNRLHGWIWDEARPEERLIVRLMRGGLKVQEAVADQGRIDLRRNGIGDGRHAFAMELDDRTAAAREAKLIARNPNEISRTQPLLHGLILGTFPEVTDADDRALPLHRDLAQA